MEYVFHTVLTMEEVLLWFSFVVVARLLWLWKLTVSYLDVTSMPARRLIDRHDSVAAGVVRRAFCSGGASFPTKLRSISLSL